MPSVVSLMIDVPRGTWCTFYFLRLAVILTDYHWQRSMGRIEHMMSVLMHILVMYFNCNFLMGTCT